MSFFDAGLLVLFANAIKKNVISEPDRIKKENKHRLKTVKNVKEQKHEHKDESTQDLKMFCFDVWINKTMKMQTDELSDKSS